MQRLILGLLVAVLCVVLVLAIQVVGLSKRLEVRQQARVDMLEARVIVLEKNIERLKAKEEIQNVRPMQDNSRRGEQ